MRFLIAAAVATWMCGTACSAEDLQGPPVFESRNGELNVIVTAKQKSVSFGEVTTPDGWVYEVCRRGSRSATRCEPDTAQSPYGGVQLKLQANDTLNLRLVNELPTVSDAKHCVESPNLANNPTNLHTHGLIVEPRRAKDPDDSFGDYVFVEVENSKNKSTACPTPATNVAALSRNGGASTAAHRHHSGHHAGTDIVKDAAEYTIPLVSHPTGLFWFHPHLHGLALNQVTSGMAGVITVGELSDECSGDGDCLSAVQKSEQRILILKDSEIKKDNALLSQQDPQFCAPTQSGAETERNGSCAGIDKNAGGRWFHTVNGQVYPEIKIGTGGAIWQLVDASASRSYELSVDPVNGAEPLALQILSLDGVTIDARAASDLATLQAQIGEKASIFRCANKGDINEGAVCSRRLRMMPSARVTLRIVNGEARALAAIFRTRLYSTGGDDWPAIDLATVNLDAGVDTTAKTVSLRGAVKEALSPAGVLGHSPTLLEKGAQRPSTIEAVQAKAVSVERQLQTPTFRRATGGAIEEDQRVGTRADPKCANLGRHEHRRIFFGTPADNPDGFALATDVVMANGKIKPGSRTPMHSFDHKQTTVCLTAARSGAASTKETWELMNLTSEDHNFHIHQTRFWLLTKTPTELDRTDEAAVLQDNVPVPHAANTVGCDGTLKSFDQHKCRSRGVRIRIPFTEIGDFVFHCHILEHEDGGMMARIRVQAPAVIH